MPCSSLTQTQGRQKQLGRARKRNWVAGLERIIGVTGESQVGNPGERQVGSSGVVKLHYGGVHTTGVYRFLAAEAKLSHGIVHHTTDHTHHPTFQYSSEFTFIDQGLYVGCRLNTLYSDWVSEVQWKYV
jgi:hypothetical protein